jgi:hypothetical protein
VPSDPLHLLRRIRAEYARMVALPYYRDHAARRRQQTARARRKMARARRPVE